MKRLSKVWRGWLTLRYYPTPLGVFIGSKQLILKITRYSHRSFVDIVGIHEKTNMHLIRRSLSISAVVGEVLAIALE